MITLRTAGYATYAAVVTLVLSGIALALFFGGAGAFWGPVNDVLVAVSLFLLIPAVLAVRDLARNERVATWFEALTYLALAGMVLAAIGQLLLVVRVIDLQTSFVTGGLGILPFLAWVGALSFLALGGGLVSRTVGLWGAAFVILCIVTVIAIPVLPQTLLYSMGVPLLVTLVGWLIALGGDLLRRA